jgi:hypothetical protein
MRKLMFIAVLAALAAAPAFALDFDAKQFYGQVEATFPMGDWGDFVSLGYGAGLGVLVPHSESTSFGLEATYLMFSTEDIPGADVSWSMIPVLFIGQYHLNNSSAYLLGGVGLAFGMADIDYDDSDIVRCRRQQQRPGDRLRRRHQRHAEHVLRGPLQRDQRCEHGGPAHGHPLLGRSEACCGLEGAPRGAPSPFPPGGRRGGRRRTGGGGECLLKQLSWGGPEPGRHPMIRKRPASERGHADHGWLDTWHTFSFADYHDPAHMGFRSLRVINDDIVKAGQGFGMHGHRDMEIVTYLVQGELEHRDSLGTGSVLYPGEVQRMSAGRGVMHSEFNHSPDTDLRLLQIWLRPAREGIDPGYEDKYFPAEEKQGRLRLIVDPRRRRRRAAHPHGRAPVREHPRAGAGGGARAGAWPPRLGAGGARAPGPERAGTGRGRRRRGQRRVATGVHRPGRGRVPALRPELTKDVSHERSEEARSRSRGAGCGRRALESLHLG